MTLAAVCIRPTCHKGWQIADLKIPATDVPLFLAKLQLDSFKVGRALAKIYVLALCFLLFYGQCRSARMARQRLMDQALHKMKLCCIWSVRPLIAVHTHLLQSELHPHFNLNIYLSILSYCDHILIFQSRIINVLKLCTKHCPELKGATSLQVVNLLKLS